MENISLREIFRLLATPIMGRIRGSSQSCGRWREAHDLVNGRAASDLCMCRFYFSQEMDRCACSGSFCLNPSYDMFMTRLWKGEALDNLPFKRSGSKKNVCLKIFHI